MHYIFDGSFSGYLCCVFEAFERREFNAIPIKDKIPETDLFSEHRMIVTDEAKWNRIFIGIEKIIGKKGIQTFYHNFLADTPQAWLNGFRLLIALFKSGTLDMGNYGNTEMLMMHQTIKKVSRERHRMKAFVRFVKSSENLYTALIEPDFNVLPLVTNFFKNRFADQHWLIYDLRRNYGYHYDGHAVQEVSRSNDERISDPYSFEVEVDPRELEFQHLWITYFKSTNIESRKNIKLHLKHVPRRYWNYLVEKKGT